MAEVPSDGLPSLGETQQEGAFSLVPQLPLLTPHRARATHRVSLEVSRNGDHLATAPTTTITQVAVPPFGIPASLRAARAICIQGAGSPRWGQTRLAVMNKAA